MTGGPVVCLDGVQARIAVRVGDAAVHPSNCVVPACMLVSPRDPGIVQILEAAGCPPRIAGLIDVQGAQFPSPNHRLGDPVDVPQHTAPTPDGQVVDTGEGNSM